MWSQKPGDRDVKGKKTSQQIIPERAGEGRLTPVSSLHPQATGGNCLMESSTAYLRRPCPQPLIPTPTRTPPAWACGSL